MSARIRQALRADVPALQRVRASVRENQLVSTIILDDDVLQAIEVTGRGWVAEVAGQVVGFAVGNAQTGNIWALFLEPAHEGQGLGRQLHDTMLTWLWSQGLQKLHLSTEPGTRAVHFYLAAGWQQAGLTPSGEVRFEKFRPPAA